MLFISTPHLASQDAAPGRGPYSDVHYSLWNYEHHYKLLDSELVSVAAELLIDLVNTDRRGNPLGPSADSGVRFEAFETLRRLGLSPHVDFVPIELRQRAFHELSTAEFGVSQHLKCYATWVAVSFHASLPGRE